VVRIGTTAPLGVNVHLCHLFFITSIFLMHPFRACVVSGNFKAAIKIDPKIIRVWTGFIWLSIGSIGKICEHGNESSVSTRKG
jgi:hypothetical protein